MKKWRVVKEFILGEPSIRLRGLGGDEGEFRLPVGTYIYQSQETDDVTIDIPYANQVGPDHTRRKRKYHFDIGTAFEKFCVLDEIICESELADIPGCSAGGDLRWVCCDDLTELVPGKVYQTPDKFVPESLVVMIRGLAVCRENLDGFVVIDDQTFAMKETYDRPLDWLMVGYTKAV